DARGREHHRGEAQGAARAGTSLQRRRHRRREAGARRQDRAGRADRLPAGPGHGAQSEVTVDINDLRSLLTVLAFASFIGIVIWAYSGRAKRAFEEAERLPFDEDTER